MFSTEILYKENYEKTLAYLEALKAGASYSRIDIEKELEALYIYEGQAWSGRGELKDAEISSTIAAYQAFLSEN